MGLAKGPSPRRKSAECLNTSKSHLQPANPGRTPFPLRSKTGEYRWFLSRALPIFDAEGKVARWFGTNTDITAQRDLEQELRESRDQLEQKVTRRTASLPHQRNPAAAGLI